MSLASLHSEAIIAWAAGATIEAKAPWSSQWFPSPVPAWLNTWQYRVRSASPALPAGGRARKIGRLDPETTVTPTKKEL